MQTTDPTAEQILAWLAEQPCPVIQEGQCHSHHRCICQGSGLAFEWASTECPCIKYEGMADGINHAIDEPPFGLDMCKPCYLFGHQDSPCHCTHGRVPKADLGLDDLWEHGLTRMSSNTVTASGLFWAEAGYPFSGEGETPTLAALRAVAAKAGMR